MIATTTAHLTVETGAQPCPTTPSRTAKVTPRASAANSAAPAASPSSTTSFPTPRSATPAVSSQAVHEAPTTAGNSSTRSGSSNADGGLPAHGTTARYAGDKRSGKPPCFCSPCRQAARRWKKRRKLVGPLTTGTASARAHLQTLIGKGATRQSIADASGCNVGTIKYVLDGRCTTIRATTAARLLAVTDASIGHAMTDATGSVRRVRALMAVGRECTEIITFGINHRLVSGLVNDKVSRIQRDKANAVAQAFAALAMTPGASLRNRRRAEREGWAPPLAWTNIDDPDETPDGWRCGTERRSAAELVEDADFITRTTGVSDKYLLAERLDVKPNTLEKARERVAARAKAGAA